MRQAVKQKRGSPWTAPRKGCRELFQEVKTEVQSGLSLVLQIQFEAL
jgi:hypothetical protein